LLRWVSGFFADPTLDELRVRAGDWEDICERRYSGTAAAADGPPWADRMGE
jgi:hypothetical protein